MTIPYRTVRRTSSACSPDGSPVLPLRPRARRVQPFTSTRSRTAATTTGRRTTTSRCVARPPPASSRSSHGRESRLLCYSNATVDRGGASNNCQVRRLLSVDPQRRPRRVYFDSRFTTYAEMNRLNARGKTSFITIRRRGCRTLRRLDDRPSLRMAARGDRLPKRRHQNIRLSRPVVRVAGYEGTCDRSRSRGWGGTSPTLLTDQQPRRDRPTDHDARHEPNGSKTRWRAVSTSLFDCLASEVPSTSTWMRP